MNAQTAVVLGATGFIGNMVVEELVKDSNFTTVRLLVRKPINASHAKVEVVITDFSNPEKFATDLGKGDCIFCCIGTTMKTVKGDKTLYRSIDYGIATDAAKFGLEAGFSKYLLVSSAGANAASSNFYVKLKGETEEAIKTMNYPALHIFRPSFLLGERKEFRLMELVGKWVMKVVGIFLIGNLRKYNGIQGGTVAKAMVQAAKQPPSGTEVYEYNAIANLAASQ